MRTLVVLALTFLLAAPLTGVATSAPSEEGWATRFARDLAAEHGAALDDLVVERRVVTSDGVVSIERIPAAVALAGHDAMRGPASAAASGRAPLTDAVIGNLLLHTMVQVGYCSGYSVEPVTDDLSEVQGTWDVGIHMVLSPVSGAAYQVPFGVSTRDPDSTHFTMLDDTSVTALGDVYIVEDRVLFHGACLALLGGMQGDGIFRFNEA